MSWRHHAPPPPPPNITHHDIVQKQRQNTDRTFNKQKILHTSPSWTNYGMAIVGTLEQDDVIVKGLLGVHNDVTMDIKIGMNLELTTSSAPLEYEIKFSSFAV